MQWKSNILSVTREEGMCVHIYAQTLLTVELFHSNFAFVKISKLKLNSAAEMMNVKYQ